MKQPTSAPRSKGPAKARRKTREELNQEGRERKRQKKHSGNTPGSRTSGDGHHGHGSGGKQNADPRIGSKKPIPLGTGAVESPKIRQPKPKSEKPMLTPEAELEMLERDDRLDALLERLEEGQSLSDEEQTWVDEKLDRIDALMQQLGLSYEDDEDDAEQQEDMMRLLKGGK